MSSSDSNKELMQLRRASDVHRQLARAQTTEEAFQRLLAFGIEALGAQTAVAFLVDPVTEAPTPMTFRTVLRQAEGEVIDVPERVLEAAIRTRQAQLTRGGRSVDPVLNLGGELPAQSELAVPVRLADSVLAVLVMTTDGTGGRLEQAHLAPLEALAAHLALWLERERARRPAADPAAARS
jgi:GAF domain-containing protein